MNTTPTPKNVGASDAQPPLLGERLLIPLERLAARLVGLSARSLRDEDNPLTHLGALSNFMLLVACVTGALLLFWYTPSHTGAYASVEAMAESPLLAGLLRTLHRYSSDAALLLAVMHGLQMFVQRRLAGPRKLAWVTGMVAVLFLWLVGWLGYWLVWDERAQAVAVGTAKMLDVLPIFTDPISRSFLTDEAVSSLLFFVVFFVHMLLPLLMVVSLWLHLARLARPRWMPSRRLSLWSIAALVVASLLIPATSAGPAAMTVTPSPATLDAWYLLPLYLTERLSGGMLWLVFLGVGLVVTAAPWWIVRRRPLVSDSTPPPGPIDVAEVDAAKCNACETCFKDCPYDAIAMVPRSDGRHFPSVALVDPDRCVGCGICAGSCDSAAIGPVWPRQVTERHKVDGWLAEAPPEAKTIVYACARSAARELKLEPSGHLVDGPRDLRVVSVPCAGWVHPLTLERAVRRGAERVVVVSCRPETCAYREGATWTADRLEGTREPALRHEQAGGKVEHLALDLHEVKALSLALGLDRGPALAAKEAGPSPRSRRKSLVAGLVFVLVLGGLTVGLAELPYLAPTQPPELVVSLRAAGKVTEKCVRRTPEELAALPPHKRIPEVCERGRGDVRLVVTVDGVLAHDQRYAPGGAFGDGLSNAVVAMPMEVGESELEVSLDLGDGPPRVTRARRSFVANRRHVLAFETLDGYRWH